MRMFTKRDNFVLKLLFRKGYPTLTIIILAVFIIIAQNSAIEAQAQRSDILIPIAIDGNTEKKLGKFPISRKYYAQALEVLSKAGFKAVILKFFLDQPKDPASDAALSKAMQGIPTILQACMQPEDKPNLLPSRFIFQGLATNSFDLIAGNTGWLPLPSLSDAASDLGFVDVRSRKVTKSLPMLEIYQGKLVKSLALAVLTLMYPDLTVAPGKDIHAGDASIPLDQNCEFTFKLPAKDDMKPVSLVDLLQERIDEKRLKGRIAYIGYDGDQQPRYDTAIGKLSPFRLYYYCLADAITRLEK